MDKIKILLVDDHKMIRDGIRASLAGTADISVVEEAASAREALKKIAQHPSIDVVVMDISLGEGEDGISVTKTITEKYQGVNILAMSMHDEETHVIKMLQAGAIGYMLKDQGMSDLVEAIRTVAGGESFFSKDVSELLMSHFVRKKTKPNAKKDMVNLTRREIEVLKKIAEEYTNQEIAEALFISPRTVDTHRRNLILKLNVKNTAGLVKYAISQQLIDM
ncbi:DNA-binding NarL/FixJ family response regulator [Catalinimonas alkaloidigena]|uniref:response regulator n=1 Tax=Catalinimonas alkaloidigena TaxID=1075417 RepID=UPI0024068595|nr:response regulator transcription factor [Catalinimonas alkaloidigena]MDF9796538.1 DNA-binding NarL/FixJ family response regulator [Catalinimonas alkaloidigena]